jgi:polysaccharide biosynthesis protein PslG
MHAHILGSAWDLLGPRVPTSLPISNIHRTTEGTMASTSSRRYSRASGVPISRRVRAIAVATVISSGLVLGGNTIPPPHQLVLLNRPYKGNVRGLTSISLLVGGEHAAGSVVSGATGKVKLQTTEPPVKSSFFGMTVKNFQKVDLSVSFGTTRSWDAAGVDWADANPSPGVYDFGPLDKFIALNEARAAEIIYTFGRTPKWASASPNAPGPYGAGQCAPPVDLGIWEAYVRAVVTEANGRIRYWEIWNEPNNPGTYCGDIQELVAMAQRAYQIIKSLDPTALVLSPSLTFTSGPSWLSSYLRQGGAAYTDVLAFHGYWSASAEDIVTVITSYKAVMVANGLSGEPMWDTESSWAGGDGNLGTPPIARQVGFIAKYYLLHWSEGVSRFIWYAYDGGPIWGGFWDVSNGASLAANAYRETYRWMVGAFLTKPCSSDSSGVWTCTLSRPGGYTAEAIWSSKGAKIVRVRPQYVNFRDLAGVVHRIDRLTVRIGDQPVLLETAALPQTRRARTPGASLQESTVSQLWMTRQ